ncbi:hypothetical protein Pint_14582 [Pistacia integerrima]|uniref:Uncharacterized protein n=1 Tax=Pistacia integerrima TaxID=434235 RepID=A0ACC0Y9J2_9ROSI|nr:hypothetical protein Pint_14582 [Pistacia integerrima]
MARLPLSQEDVNNFMATFLLRRNRQFIGHRLHPTATKIRNINYSTTIRPALGAFINALTTNQVQRMLRDMSLVVLRKLKGFSLDNENINPDGGNNVQQNNSDGNNNE